MYNFVTIQLIVIHRADQKVNALSLVFVVVLKVSMETGVRKVTLHTQSISNLPVIMYPLQTRMNAETTNITVVLLPLVLMFMVDISVAVWKASVAMVKHVLVSYEFNSWQLNKEILTADIDECTEGTHGCPVGSTCQNTYGSYRCNCMGRDCKGATTGYHQ